MRNFIPASRKWFVAGLIMVFLAVALVGCGNQAPKEPESQQGAEPVTLLVSAAASLTDAMGDIEKAYQEEHSNVSFDFNLASSGSLQEQIANGAPADLFISAAKGKMDALDEKDLIVKETRKDILKNTLVLIVAKDNENIKSFEDLEKAQKIAMGEPDSVPAGKYASETLTSLNLLDKVKGKLVYAKDVRQVLAKQLVHQAASARLEIGMIRIGRAHPHGEAPGHLVLGDSPHLLHVVLAVEKVGVNPPAAALE